MRAILRRCLPCSCWVIFDPNSVEFHSQNRVNESYGMWQQDRHVDSWRSIEYVDSNTHSCAFSEREPWSMVTNHWPCSNSGIRST